MFNGQPYTISGGTVCFVRDHDRHLYEHTDNLCLTNVLYRSPDAFQFLSGLNQLLPQEKDGHYPSHWRVNQSTLQQVRQLVSQMEQSEDGQETHAIATRELLFMQLLVLLRRSSPVEGLENNDARLNQLMAWLEDHFAEDVCWETLADDFSLSLRTLHRQLKQHTGLTPQRYLNRLRLIKARHLYVIPTKASPISPIAAVSATVTTFRRCFAGSLAGRRAIFVRERRVASVTRGQSPFLLQKANNVRLFAVEVVVWLLSSFFAKMIFASASQAVAVADRYPQNVFAEHTHEFCELVLVWRGNGLHVLNDRPYRITRGDLFYIRAEDKHSYASVNDLVLQNVIYCPDRLKLNVDWAGNIPGFHNARGEPHWRLSSNGMAQVRQTISQLEQESQKSDPVANQMSELLFAQLVMTLKRHRYATDNPSATMQEALLDKLITRLAGSLNKSFVLEKFCEQEQCSERALRQQFRTQTGMTVNHYLRQLRICHAQYLLQHTELMVSEVAMRCGFEDSNYFSVVFNREVGMTPVQWRHRSRKAA